MPDGTGYLVLHGFVGGPDGAQPSAGLTLGSDNGLYGVTGAGGSSNAGTVFRLDSAGGNYRVLHSFGLLSSDGIAPNAALFVGADSGLYGTTAGGGVSNLGTIFRLDPSGSGYRVLRSFAGGLSDGANPVAGLVQGLDGNLYGITQKGGQHDLGILFKLGTNGAGFELLQNYTNPPQSLTRTAAGTFYGTTVSGGTQNAGSMFQLSPDGTDFKVLYNFDRNPLDGDRPYSAPVQDSDGTLYGTTPTSATNGPGVAFSLQPDGTGFTVLHRFGSIPSDGEAPQGPLILGADGALYGATLVGGSSGAGTVFRLTKVPYAQPPPFQLSIAPMAGGTLRVSCSGALGLTYVLQTSTDLANWLSAGSISNETGTVEFLQWNGATYPQRFYRMIQSR